MFASRGGGTACHGRTDWSPIGWIVLRSDSFSSYSEGRAPGQPGCGRPAEGRRAHAPTPPPPLPPAGKNRLVTMVFGPGLFFQIFCSLFDVSWIIAKVSSRREFIEFISFNEGYVLEGRDR